MHIVRFIRFFLVIFALVTIIALTFWLLQSSVMLEKEKAKETETKPVQENTQTTETKNISDYMEYWFPFPQNTNLRLVCNDKNPKTVQIWRKTLGVDFTFNAGYFDENNTPVGYVKTEKKTWGKAENYPAFLGFNNTKNQDNNFLEITVAKSDENIEKKFEFIIESFPLLVENSKKLFPRETHKYANRTIVGERNGKWGVYFLLYKPSLFQSSQTLVEKGFSTAINLDGGPSTGFSSKEKEIFSIKVPCVLAGRY